MVGRIYRTAQILSLDIVIGAVILLRFFCAQLEVQVSWSVYSLLAITVWLIYTWDHIQDAEKAPQAKRLRYLFHRKHKSILILISICLILFMVPMVFFIPLAVLLGGLLLGLLSLLYLIVQGRLSTFFSKELYVAFVYSAGILMVPLLMGKSLKLEIWFLLLLLSFMNLILFSWFEKQEDARDGFDSLATLLGEKRLEKLIFVLGSFGLAISFLRLNEIGIFFFIGFLTYTVMIITPKWFRKNERYRAIGDSVFLWPILFEWL